MGLPKKRKKLTAKCNWISANSFFIINDKKFNIEEDTLHAGVIVITEKLAGKSAHNWTILFKAIILTDSGEFYEGEVHVQYVVKDRYVVRLRTNNKSILALKVKSTNKKISNDLLELAISPDVETRALAFAGIINTK